MFDFSLRRFDPGETIAGDDALGALQLPQFWGGHGFRHAVDSSSAAAAASPFGGSPGAAAFGGEESLAHLGCEGHGVKERVEVP